MWAAGSLLTSMLQYTSLLQPDGLELKAHNPRRRGVWAKGDAQRTIAALELLGTILAVVLFDPEGIRKVSTTCGVTGGIDNKGNSHIVQKLISTKFPITPLVIELSEQLRSRGAELHLRWIPRLSNQEADDLSILKFDDFRGFSFQWQRFPG